MDVYEVREKIQIVKWYFQNRSYRDIQTIFPQTFVNRPIPSLPTISRVINNFETHGCVSPQKHKKPDVLINEEQELKQVFICATADQNPTFSSNQIAEVVALPTMPVLFKNI